MDFQPVKQLLSWQQLIEKIFLIQPWRVQADSIEWFKLHFLNSKQESRFLWFIYHHWKSIQTNFWHKLLKDLLHWLLDSVVQTLLTYVMRQPLLPQERKDSILKILIFNKLQRELWLDMSKKGFPTKKPKKELLIMKQDMLFVHGT